MGRVQLFEFHDLGWFPREWRDLLTDIMQVFAVRFDPFRPIVPKLREALASCGESRVIDLCTGASGPLLKLLPRLDRGKHPVTAVLTDKYPNLPALRRAAAAAPGWISACETSVDALDVPARFAGFRTLFGSFHHFPPAAARGILRNAVTKSAGIGIFEYTERSPVWFLAALFSPLFCWLAGPFVLRPFTWRRFFWIYLCPIPVFCAAWDGLVSGLRTYSPDELRQLVRLSDGSESYAWDIGRVRSFGGCRITYLIGVPPS